MPRYLTFDEKTASALRTQVPQQLVFEHGAEDAVDYAVHSDRSIVAVMPTVATRQAAIAVFRKPAVAAKPVTSAPKVEARKRVASAPIPPKDAAIRAGGFLGLSDESIFDEDQPATRKKQSWWRKIWPEDE
jgi:hypothetical protein